MQKQEFLELCEAAIQAARGKNGDKNSPDVLRCVEAMNRLKEASESLVIEVLEKNSIGSRFYREVVEHENPQIRSEARLLRDLWLMYFYASGTQRSTTTTREIPVKTGDSKRDKVRDILQTSLAKVATEVVEIEMKKRVASCDPLIVAVSVESAMFEKLGCFTGPEKAKYRSILFNMGDSNNPDLRRKVLIGEISGEKLVTMEKEEMGSDKIRMEVQQIKEKARLKEENRIKMFQSDPMMT